MWLLVIGGIQSYIKHIKPKWHEELISLDLNCLEEVRNKPFMHNYNINDKDVKTGGLRKVIRLLKTLKYDAEKDVKISSYDIASLAYNRLYWG